VGIVFGHANIKSSGSQRHPPGELQKQGAIEVWFFLATIHSEGSRRECFFAVSALKAAVDFLGALYTEVAFSDKVTTAGCAVMAAGIGAMAG
jgi:hypothetical protein